MTGVYSVSQISSYIRNLFTKDYLLSRVTVRGEVSNCKYHSSGHIYFTLKDPGAAISCVMFASQREHLTFRLQDGQQIEASGQVSVYEKNGSYQLYVRSCRLSGAGELYERFLKLKEELEEMGMFDEIYKKPIPKYCRRIGIVTASTGAAVQDIINVTTRRNPYVELVLYPARVQGEGAKESIVRGIERLDRMGLDVLIVGRGGGSIEDLWAFNEECVARAIFDAETPVISAVGHETDFTIADFVADRRAPTPSAAAELASFEYDAFEEELAACRGTLDRNIMQRIRIIRHRLEASAERLQRLSPQSVLQNKKERLETIRRTAGQLIRQKAADCGRRLETAEDRLQRDMGDKALITRNRLQITAARLEGHSPLKKMSGGYGYVKGPDGKGIRSVLDVSPGDTITTYLKDGKVTSSVTGTEDMLWQRQ